MRHVKHVLVRCYPFITSGNEVGKATDIKQSKLERSYSVSTTRLSYTLHRVKEVFWCLYLSDS